MSTILAINDGIGSSAGIFKNGKPVLCFEEERFNRKKNWLGFPHLAVDRLLEDKSLGIDYVVLTNERVISGGKAEFDKYYLDNFEMAVEQLTSNVNRTKKKLKDKVKRILSYESKSADQKDLSTKKLTNLGFKQEQIIRLNHHMCHAAAAYYGLAESLDEKYLVMTLDGGGDDALDTVNIGHNGDLVRQTHSMTYSIGNIYSCVTYFLGFKAHEHEYKLMGLAPYVNPDYADEYCKYFEKFLDLKNDDTEFFNPIELNHSKFFYHLLNDLNRDRFDNIAAGLQLFCEKICLRWVQGNIRKYGINKLLLSGGVFMNVKLNKLISQLEEVNFVNVFPSCGDETNIFGAAFKTHNDKFSKEVGLLSKFTLGTTPYADFDSAVEKYKDQITVEKVTEVNKKVAELLASNNIVARCSGEMEFGARALGNRSIMANPSRLQNITKINHAIKKRDFWMPFAPAMIVEDAVKYVEIPNSIKSHGSPYMMFAMDTHEDDQNRQEIICGIHQNDFTARVEGVTQERYPDFYEIITEFKVLTNIPCVLNTSFNLHGFPIVESSEQAIYVLVNSKIDYLVIGDNIIRRR